MKKGHEDMKIKVLKTFQEKVHWLYQFVKRIHNMHNRRLRISALDSWGKKTIQMCLEASNLFLYKKKKSKPNHLLRIHKGIVIKF